MGWGGVRVGSGGCRHGPRIRNPKGIGVDAHFNNRSHLAKYLHLNLVSSQE